MKLTNYLSEVGMRIGALSVVLLVLGFGAAVLPMDALAADRGTITFCMIAVDEDGDFVGERDNVPDGTFSISLKSEDDETVVETVEFETDSFNPNTNLIGSAGNDAECVDFRLPFGTYTWSEVDIDDDGEWSEAEYDVTSGDPADDLDDYGDFDDDEISLDDDESSWTISFVTSLGGTRDEDEDDDVEDGDVPSSLIDDVEAQEVLPGMVLVRWETDKAGTSMVVYGNSGVSDSEVERSGRSDNFGYDASTDEVKDPEVTAHKVAVMSVAPGATIYMRPVSEIDGETAIGSQVSLRASGSAVPAVGGQQAKYLNSYLKRGASNDPIEVTKLQTFLKSFGGYDVSANGIFDDKTHAAVVGFQERYSTDILAPWGYTRGTGYVYILTVRKINEIMSGKPVALTEAEAREIASYTAPVSGGASGARGESPVSGGTVAPASPSEGVVPVPPVATTTGPTDGLGTGSTIDVGDDDEPATTTGLKEGVLGNLASAVFSLPSTGTEMTRCIFNLVIILAIIYIVTSILVGNDDAGMPRSRVRFRKLMFFLGGTIIALAFALFFDMFCLILPLGIVLILNIAALLWNKFGGDRTPTQGSAGGGANPPSMTPLIVEETKQKTISKPVGSIGSAPAPVK